MIEHESYKSHGRQIPEGFKVITEGRASILENKSDAFYNPAQVYPKPENSQYLRMTTLPPQSQPG